MAASPHFTAVLKISYAPGVEEPATPIAHYRDTVASKQGPKLDAPQPGEVLSLVLRAPTLEALAAKLANHVALIEA